MTKLLCSGLALLVMLPTAIADLAAEREKAAKFSTNGNFKEALAVYREVLADTSHVGQPLARDLAAAVDCLAKLNQGAEFDGFVEAAIKAHDKDWRLLAAAAELYSETWHFGSITGGEFERGSWKGRQVDTTARDRTRALQLIESALEAAKEENAEALTEFHLDAARVLLPPEAFKLQSLTSLGTLPEYDEYSGGGWPYVGGSEPRAPVTAAGLPVYHSIPASWAASKSDGERWRWLLAQAATGGEVGRAKAALELGDFMRSQIGESTLASWRHLPKDDDQKAGTYALHTLKDDETLARLATGPKRFAMPDEFNYIKLYHQAAEQRRDAALAQQALASLADVYADRRQLPRAAEMWKKLVDDFGGGEERFKARHHYEQIVGSWGRFEALETLPWGREPKLGFVFRNGNKVRFTARRIDLAGIIASTKELVRRSPVVPDEDEMIDLTNLGSELGGKPALAGKFLSEPVARWETALEPRPNHQDRRIDVPAPLTAAGAYWIEATMDGGNTCRVVLNLADTVIVEKALDRAQLFIVSDAVTGQPLARASVEFFGVRERTVRGRDRLDIRRFAETTDEQGQVVLREAKGLDEFNWLVTAATAGGRFAVLPSDSFSFNQRADATYNTVRVFTVTDRPVYRPGQVVKWKAWVREANYDLAARNRFSKQKFFVTITDGQNAKTYEKSFESDESGGITGEATLGDEAALGVYSIQVGRKKDDRLGGGTFRVEEYKKPEFEVAIEAPKEPVALGEKISATVKATYYFGAPVVKAKARFTVRRSEHSARWFPTWRWDWFYGSGAWWFGADYAWYPGFSRWGCLPPVWSWWHGSPDPPELVLENEVPIGADGTVKIEIDTAAARELLGDTDHRYDLSVEVTDESRRTITGAGAVLVARDPFRIYAWTDRGHYEIGDAIEVGLRAQTLDGKGVEGKGRLTLFQVSYNEKGEPQEKEAAAFEVATDVEGEATQRLSASEQGQYRVSYKLTDAKGHSQEGGHVFVVRGPGFDGRGFRFNALELITDRKAYAPGELVNLMINTEKADSTVWLFIRSSHGICPKPTLLRLAGKSAVEAIKIEPKDMPNIYVEALTIADGKVHSATREILIPPESRMLTLEVRPSAEKFKPRETAKVKLKLTGPDGNPFIGWTIVTGYDKALESISGGSNVPNIREFFWKWRRWHRPETVDSLLQGLGNNDAPDEQAMEPLGGLGHHEGYGEIVGMSRGLWRRGDAFSPPPPVAMMGGLGSGAGLGAGSGGSGLVTGGLRFGTDAISNNAIDGLLSETKTAGWPMTPTGQVFGASTATEMPIPMIRSNFADALFWAASVGTDAAGEAEVEIPLPDTLTTWKIKSWAMGSGTRVGEASAEVITSKDLLVRLQAPRFFVERDEVVLSANVHSYLTARKDVSVSLELEGGCLERVGSASGPPLTLEPNSEQRVDWRVKVVREGSATVRVKAVTDTDSDAVEVKYPVFVHGMLKTDSWSGALGPDQNAGVVEVTVPAERRPEQTELEVRFSPSLAMAMLDAIPYLAEYPYGCTEQTLNRFLPAVLAQRALKRLGVDLKGLQKKTTNLNAQEIGDPAERAKQWKRFERNPIFSEQKMNKMVKAGLERLTNSQSADGGWSWFPGARESDAHITATVVHGLQMAKASEVALVPGVLDKGLDWLGKHQAAQVRLLKNAPTKTKPWKDTADDLDAFVYLVLVEATLVDRDMMEFLCRDRNGLSLYAKALLGLAFDTQGQLEKRDMLLQNLEQFLETDPENQTAHLRLENRGFWWRWYGSEFEAQAWYLKLLARVKPRSETASGLVKYLVNNRRNATWWNSTRDTALCLEAIGDYLKATGEGAPDLRVEVWVDGTKQKEARITRENLFTFDNRLLLRGEALAGGKQTIEFRKEGKGPLYFNAYLTNFTLEDPIPPAGLEVKIERRYWKLTPTVNAVSAGGSKGQLLEQKTEGYDRTELKSGDPLKSGELAEVELIIDSKNDYEYVVIEDMKPAGFEATEVRSGWSYEGLAAYQELRDEKTAFFVRSLPLGRSTLRYRLRAEIPGQFSALPAKANAMYAPELRGNSAEMEFSVVD